MERILVSVKEKYLECEKPEGVSESILGSLILGVTKVDQIPSNLKVIDNPDSNIITFFDKDGIEKVYRDSVEDPNHYVMASKRFVSDESDEEDKDGYHTTYYAFTEKSYEKLMTLFEKENRLFQYSV